MAGQGKSLPPKLRRKARQAAGKQPKAAPDAKQNSQTGQQAPSANTNHPSPGLPVRLPGGLLDALPLLQCPLCSQPLRPRGHSLVCRRDHCFDVSAKGYVNFVPGRAPAREHDAVSFTHRRRFLMAGFYDHVVQGILDALGSSGPQHVLDAGCGDGFFARRIASATEARVLALDNAREAIQTAVRGEAATTESTGNRTAPAQDARALICWMEGDLARLPLKAGAVDVVLTAFAPANYGQFARVLAPGGRVIKLVPGNRHLQQLRQAAREQLRGETYESSRVVDYFTQHLQLVEQRTLTATLPLEGEALDDLLAMTPLLFGADRAAIDRRCLDHITIEAELLVGEAQGRMPR